MLQLVDTIKEWEVKSSNEVKDKLKQIQLFIEKAEKLDIFGNIIEEKKSYYKEFYSKRVEEID